MTRIMMIVAVAMAAGGFAIGWLTFGASKTVLVVNAPPAPSIGGSPATENSQAEVEHRFRLGAKDVHADREHPSIAIDGQGRVLVAWAAQSGDLERTIVLARSADGGTRFETPAPWRKVPIYRFQSRSSKKPMTFSTHVLPRVVADGDAFWLGWVEAVDGGPTVRYLAARSTDGGASFSEPIAIHGGDAVKPGFTTLAMGADGALCAAWLDGRNKTQQPFFTVKPAAAAAFGPERLVFEGPEGGGICPCCDLAVARTPDGTDFVAFRNSDHGHRDIWITRSEPGGAGFAPPRPATADPWSFDGCPHDGPALALNGNRLHLIWMDAHTGKNRLYTASSPCSALSFSPRELTTGSDRSQGHPRLVAGKGGTLHAVWDESLGTSEPSATHGHGAGHASEHAHAALPSGDGRVIRYAYAASEGDSTSPGFTAARAVAPRPGAFQLNPALAVGPDGRVLVAWTEIDADGKQVAVARLDRPQGQVDAPAAGD